MQTRKVKIGKKKYNRYNTINVFNEQ